MNPGSPFRVFMLFALMVELCTAATPDKSGVKPSVLSLPSGPGSIEGLGGAFEPQLNTGTSVYSVKIVVPPGVAGHQPTLSLSYNSGSGNGPLGIGWALDLPKITRQTEKGNPQYQPGDVDTYVYGSEELVPLSDGTYRCENESEFTRLRVIDASGNPVSADSTSAAGWEATLRDGKRMLFGRSAASRVSIPNPPSGAQFPFAATYGWILDSFFDTNGNEIRYQYTMFDDSPGVLYLTGVEYARSGAFRHEVQFDYSPAAGMPGARTDIFSDYRPGFEVTTSRRMTTISVLTDGHLVRRYLLGYDPDPAINPGGNDLPLGFSLLQSIKQVDSSGSAANYLPPLRFAYASFQMNAKNRISQDQALRFTRARQPAAPGFHLINPGGMAAGWQDGKVEVVDINGDGLADFVNSGSPEGHIAYLNTGKDAFSAAVLFSQSPGSAFDDDRITLADIDGNGLTDLIERQPNRVVAYMNTNGFDKTGPLGPGLNLAWGAQTVIADEDHNPAFPGFNQPDIRQVDLNNDKRPDLIQTFQDGYYYYLRTADGWSTQHQARVDNGYLPEDWSFSDARFDVSSPDIRRAELADMNGDRLQDWVVLSNLDGNSIRITYWPNSGGGRFVGPKRTMVLSSGGDPVIDIQATLQDARLMDVNQDGLSDLVLPGRRTLVYWINLGGDHWSAPLSIASPPNNTVLTTLRAMDVNGNGTTDLLWDNHRNLGDLTDQNGDGLVDYNDALTYYDFVGDIKPNLLQVIDNGIGRRTFIEYKPSTVDYLSALDAGQSWTTKLPFPVQVVSRIINDIGLDLNGDGKPDQYITDITYRDGYYDAFEQEFRGFAFAQKIQRGDDYNSATGVTSAGTSTVSGPSLVTRHRFLTGSPDGADNDDYPAGYAGLRATDEGSGTGMAFSSTLNDEGGREEECLKGRPVFVETVDPAVLNAPVAEKGGFDAAARACALAAYSNPFCSAAQSCTPDKYVYSRVHTDWKIRRLYRPQGIINPPGRFSTLAQVGKSVSFAFTETTENEIIGAAGLLHELLDGKPVDYPARPKKVTRTVSTFDDYGNLVRDANYGVVSGTDVSVQNDERIKKTAIALGGEALMRWIINRPSVERVEDENGVFVSETRHFYDGAEMVGLPLGIIGARGLEKRSEEVITEDPAKLPALDAYDADKLDRPGDPRLAAGASIAVSRTAHDVYGNAIVMLDPLGDLADIQLQPSASAPTSALPATGNKGHFRVIRYDGERHIYPVEERIAIGVGKPDLVMSAQYDPGFGVATRVLDFNSNPTDFKYDSFARLVAIIKPGDSLNKPTQAFQYRPADSQRNEVYLYDSAGNLAGGKPQVTAPPAANAVETRQREDISTSSTYNTFNSIQYSSGNGQALMTVEEGETPDRWVVKGAVLYNLRGASWATYQPYYRPDSAFHLAGAGGTQHDEQPVTATYRSETKSDATGRAIEALNPPETFGGIRTRVITQNLPLESRTFDEEDSSPGGRYFGTPMEHLQDGLSRLIEVHEVTRLNDDGTTAATTRSWITRYRYDLSDNLVHIQDSQNNEKWMRYDGLGRRVFMNDPDRGMMVYTYDSASNLLETLDAKGQRITYAYDGVNRLLSEDYHDEGRPFSANQSPDVKYHYDEPAGLIDLGDTTRAKAANAKGYLSWIEDLSGEEHNSYDARGRVEWVVKRLPDLENGLLRSFKTAYTYDALDRVRDLIYPDNDVVTHGYNARNLMETISGGAPHNAGSVPFVIASSAYIPSGQLSSCTYGNGVVTAMQYDPRLRMRSSRATSGQGAGASLIAYDYTFDAASNITRIDDRRPAAIHPAGDPLRNTQIFKYDDLYRLTYVQYSFALPGESDRDDGNITYRYDRIGNMLVQLSNIDHVEKGKSVTHHGAMSFGGTLGQAGRIGRGAADPPGPHALTATASGRNYPYDANGNITDIDGMVATWDFKDRLMALENDKLRAEYIYDYNDKRVLKKVTAKMPDPERPLADPPTTTTLYVDRNFELREHGEPVKYVWRGEMRIAQCTGTLTPDRERVQRFSLQKGWNLISLSILLTSGLGDHPELKATFLWDRSARAWSSVSVNSPLPAGAVLFIYANATFNLDLRGALGEPGLLLAPAGGGYIPAAVLDATALNVPNGCNAAWLYTSASAQWKNLYPTTFPIGFASATPYIKPGAAFYLDTPVAATAITLAPKNSRIHYYYQDHLGSTNILLDGDGNLLGEFTYYAFGHSRKREQASDPRKLISGKYLYLQNESDGESELQYFKARYLHTISGRFISIDPCYCFNPNYRRNNVCFKGIYEAKNINTYSLSYNNPILFSDPDGMAAGALAGAGTGAAVGAVSGGLVSAALSLIKQATSDNPISLSKIEQAAIEGAGSGAIHGAIVGATAGAIMSSVATLGLSSAGEFVVVAGITTVVSAGAGATGSTLVQCGKNMMSRRPLTEGASEAAKSGAISGAASGLLGSTAGRGVASLWGKGGGGDVSSGGGLFMRDIEGKALNFMRNTTRSELSPVSVAGFSYNIAEQAAGEGVASVPSQGSQEVGNGDKSP